MYELVTWFTECPYFNLLASICSIGSAIAIIDFFYFKKAKPITTNKEAEEIVNILIEKAEQYSDFWLPFDEDGAKNFLDLKGQKIDCSHSFTIMIDYTMDFPTFALVKTHKDLRLYGCLDATKSSYRLITTNLNTPALENLLAQASVVEDLSNEEFLDQILGSLKNSKNSFS